MISLFFKTIISNAHYDAKGVNKFVNYFINLIFRKF